MDIYGTDKKKKSFNYSLNKSLDKLENENNPQRDPSNKSREKELQEFESSLHQLRDKALSIYRHELNRPASIDLGLHGTSRAALRTLCKSAVLESSTAFRRRYSQSNASSVTSYKSMEKDGAVSALRLLQKERLIVTRLGFPDKAMELDRQIEEMRIKAKRARDEEENRVLYQRMKNLAISHRRKEQRLETIIANELTQIKLKFQEEEEKMIKRQEVDFLRVLEAASRRALGRVKKCNCDKEYVCRHNKTASYNTRRPIYTVVLYRRNAKRLKRAGRPEEAQIWSEKANAIDDGEQEKWRTRVADSIVSSPWGANEASVDQITELHKKELAVLRKTHAVKLDMLEKKHVMRRKNFRNTILAEERKVRMQCRKQALLRLRKNYTEEQREEERQRSLQEESDGLKNVSKNLLGANFTEADRAAIDWVPPVAFGLDNSVRLIDAVNEVGREQDDENQGGPTRIFTSRADIAKMGLSEIQEKVRRVAGGNNEDVNSEDDSEEEEEEDDEEGEEADENKDTYYKLGETSGSKLVDKMRLQVHKDKMAIIAKNKERGSNSSSQGSEAAPPPVLAQPPVAFSFPTMPNVNTGFPVLNPFSASLPFAPGPLAFQSPLSATSNSTNTVTGGFLNRVPAFNMGAMGGNPFDNMTTGSLPGMAFANPFSPASTDIIDKTPTVVPAQTNDVLSYFNDKPAPKDDAASFTSPVRPIVAPPAPTAPAPTTPSFRAGMHINQSEEKSNKKAPPAKDIVDLNSRRVHQSQLYPDDSKLNNFCHPSAEERNSTSRPQHSNTGGEGHVRPVLIRGTKLTIPLALDWSFDPAVDENPAMSFEAGSRRDEDWQENDNLLKEGCGSENSYGISLILPDETIKKLPPSQLSSSILKIDNIIQMGHEPPAPGTPSSIPQKSSLSKKAESGKGSLRAKKSASVGNNSTRKVKFGENKVCTFEANDNEDEGPSNAVDEPYVPFVFPPTAELPFVQGSGITMPSFSSPPSFLAANPFAPSTPQLNTHNPFVFPQPSFSTAVSEPAKLFASGAAPPVQLSFEGHSNPLTGLENPMQSMRVSSNSSVQTASSDHSSLQNGSLPFEHSSGPLQSSTIQSSFQSQLDTVAVSGHVEGEYDKDFVKVDDISPLGSCISEPPKSDTPLVPHPPSAHRPPGARPSVMKGIEKGSASENRTSSDDQLLHSTAPPQLQSAIHKPPPIQIPQTLPSQWSSQTPFSEPHHAFQSQSLQLAPQMQPQQLPFIPASQPFPSNANSFLNPSSSFQIPPSVSNPFSSAPSTSFPPNLMVNTSSFNVSPEDDNKKGGSMKSSGLNDSIHTGGSASPTASYQQLNLNRHSSKTSMSEGTLTEIDDSNSSVGLRGVQRCSFNWQLCFFRWTNLSNVVATLETVLNDDDFYEAAELYISTQDPTTLDENGEIDAFSASTNDVAWVQETTMKLQLLRGWKKFNTNPNDIELLLMGMEEVLGMDQEEIMEDVIGAIASKQTVLNEMLASTAYEFIPNFIMSEDFTSYFDSHYAPMKAIAKNFHVDSKSWLGRFQKTAADLNVPVHLFLPPASKNGPRPRPYANKIMRSIFGTMVDAPSPREYIDNSTDPDTIENIMMSMKEGVDTTSGVVCRTLKTGKVPSFLYIKHLYSVKEPTKLKYSVVMIADRTKPNSDMLAKVATAMIQCLPTATKE